MTRWLRRRIEKLEGARPPQERPKWIVGTCPLPDAAPTADTIDEWLASGAAHIGFSGHAVIYDGGRGKLTVGEWLAEHASSGTLN